MNQKLNPYTAAGLCVYFLMMAFVAVWMLQGNLSAGDMMWATIIICSTTAVVLYLTGEQNRREREMAVRETRRDAVRDRHLREEIQKLKEEFGASAEERALIQERQARIEDSQALIIEMVGSLTTELKLKNAKRSGYVDGFVAGADDDNNDGAGGKLHRLYPRQPHSDPERDDLS